MVRSLIRRIVIPIATLASVLPVLGREPGESANSYYQAYYRETALDDPAGAAELYAEFVKNTDAPADLLADARERLAGCREDVRTADLATLAPADTLVFVELRRPGEHLARLADMLGLAGDPLANVGAASQPMPDAPGMVLPQHVMISRAILERAKDFRGAAFALTGLSMPEGRPEGVLMLHPGQADVLRGLLETGAQFVQAGEPLAGFPTVRIQAPDFSAVVAFTHRMVIAGTSRELVSGVLDRLASDKDLSLASSEAFRTHAGKRDDALLYAYFNAAPILRLVESQMQAHPQDMQEFAAMRVLLDLDHLQSASVTIGAAPDALQAEAAVTFAEGQMSLVYNLLRLPPMRGSALAHVPAGAAAVLSLGINPAEGPVAAPASAGALTAITGLDLGREIFANLREVAVFVLPPSEGAPAGGPPIPDAGLVLSVADVAKSEALWTYLLSLPGRFSGTPQLQPESLTLEGVTAQAFALPNGIKIYFARKDDAILIASTPSAIVRSAKSARGASVMDDAALRGATGQIGADTSVALWVHGGRVAELAMRFAPPAEQPKLRLVAEAARETVLTVLIDESATRLHFRGRLAGLPKVDRLFQVLEQAGAFGAGEHHELAKRADDTAQ